MPKSLVTLSVSAPGFYGLNTQHAGSVLPPGWATVAENLVYDEVGRLASRNGSQRINSTVITNTPTIKAIHEYVDASNNKVNIVACDNKIYKEVSGTMTDVSGTITTPTADNWQFVNFNGWCVGFQENHAPIVTTSATTPAFANSGGTQYNGSMVAVAGGRLWTVFGNTLYYSDLLINNFTGGSAGNFDLSKFWPNGMDVAVAISEFNGYLVVFGEKSIIVYENVDDVTVMSIVEGVSGIGCPFRDSIQSVGDDLVFLSNSGLRSFKRTVLQKTMPLTEISIHVRDELMQNLDSETAIGVKSVYNEREGFYLVSLPVSGISYYFHVHTPNEDGTWKATNWTIAPTALAYSQDKTMLFAVDAGYLSEYRGYLDSVLYDGSGGTSYVIDYEGVWNDFGEEVAEFLKIPKRFNVLASGVSGGTVTMKWAVDYKDTFRTTPLAFITNSPSRFGVAQFSIATFLGSGQFERIKANASGAGQVIKIGLTSPINGSVFALQRIDVLAKIGRIGI